MRERRFGMRWPLVLALFVTGILGGAATNAQAEFGVASLSGAFASTQAGAHTDFSTSLSLNRDALGNPEGQLKTATFTLPAGSTGNAQAIERCSVEMLEQLACTRSSQVGELSITAVRCAGTISQLQAPTEAGATRLEVSDAQAFCSEEGSGTITVGTGSASETVTIASIVNGTTLELAAPMARSHQVGEDVAHIANVDSEAFPIYNLQPSAGHLATFSAALSGALFVADVFINVNVGEDGRLMATISETSTVLQIVSSTVTLWGVPAASSHDTQRCNELLECGPSAAEPAAFMTNPTSCSGTPQEAVTVASWQGQSAASVVQLPSLTGCEQLSMSPSLAVAPSTTRQDTPAGYEVLLHVPQDESPYGLATPALERISVTLPRGTSLSPGLANGLQPCEPVQFSENLCPDASRIGSAEVTAPLLPEALDGAIYIGTPSASEKYRLFLRISGDDVAMELRGDVEANVETGQLTTVFQGLPELPLASVKLNFFGGPAAALANQPTCGPATSSGSIVSYGEQTMTVSSAFEIDEDSEGGPCPLVSPFTPSFTAGTRSVQAGQTSPFVLSISRADGQQDLSSFTVHLPPGLIGLIGSVPLCLEPAAAAGMCPPASEVGSATVAAGAGPAPLYVSGPIYLTGPYDGTPFGLEIAIDAAVGPFDLGTVLVRSRILIDPSTLAITIASDSFPQVVGGVPLRLRSIEATLGRAGFIVNPTSCAPQSITATITSSEGAAANLSTPFRVAECTGLSFAPHVSVSAQAAASAEGDGASLSFKVVNPPSSQANFSTVTAELPDQLRPRLRTLQGACRLGRVTSLHACPPTSAIGRVMVSSPEAPALLSGSLYLVAHSGSALPSLRMALEGGGLEVELEGALRLSRKEAPIVTFKGLPDVRISSLAVTLPRGPHSILGDVGSLCAKPVYLGYSLGDHGGGEVKGRARMAVQGCPSRRKTPTRVKRKRHQR